MTFEVQKISMPVQPATPMEMLSRAMMSGAAPETLEKLLALQERWEHNQASKAFDEAFGAGYPGILVNNGTDTVRNSAILPETENRLLPGISGDILLELSFNGLLSASIGSFLGLPDLFDTKTGHSAIGRFGLMDGQAIFSFAGLYPPEPSAWEKYWLGWITPIDVSGEHLINLPADL
jgi:hypothetical protein